jgi:hypothetical protein
VTAVHEDIAGYKENSLYRCNYNMRLPVGVMLKLLCMIHHHLNPNNLNIELVTSKKQMCKAWGEFLHHMDAVRITNDAYSENL